MKKLFSFLLIFLFVFSAFSCGEKTPDEGRKENDQDIVILFTNDVHCNVDENIGYAGLWTYKEKMKKETSYVSLIDCGDAIQGSFLSSVSQGELLIDIMNLVGYDYATFGNHEFDYGMERLSELIGKSNHEYLCCNFRYTGSGENRFENLKPFEIKTYGNFKVGFLGIATPKSTSESAPGNFKENGEYVYDFLAGESAEEFYLNIQKSIDECRKAGADYVVAMAHLGNEETAIPYTSRELIAHTSGLDVLLDGHSHSFISMEILKNKEEEDVLMAQTGTGLSSIGKMVIQKGGEITLTCIEDFTEKEEGYVNQIAGLVSRYDEILNEVIVESDCALPTENENGIRLVRNRETGIGNFCADALRVSTGADIAYVNGGGIRAGFPKGEITYRDVLKVHPFGNMFCTMKLTGQEILDMLEYFSSETKREVEKDNEAYGEGGSFANVSGLRYTIHTEIPTSVVVDENDMLLLVEDSRRVSDVQVLENGEYVPLNPEKIYTLAGADYMMKKGGSGMEKFLAGHSVELDSIMPDYMGILNYLKSGVDLSQYEKPEGRITVID